MQVSTLFSLGKPSPLLSDGTPRHACSLGNEGGTMTHRAGCASQAPRLDRARNRSGRPPSRRRSENKSPRACVAMRVEKQIAGIKIIKVTRNTTFLFSFVPASLHSLHPFIHSFSQPAMTFISPVNLYSSIYDSCKQCRESSNIQVCLHSPFSQALHSRKMLIQNINARISLSMSTD